MKSPTPDVVRKVFQGFYGNGVARVEKLRADGYDDVQTQSMVNKVVSLAKGIKDGSLNYGKNKARISKIDKELGVGYGQLVQDEINVLYGIRKW